MKQVLEEKGVLSELKAKIRAEIFESLQIGKELGVANVDDEENDNQKNKEIYKLKWNKQELVINELIKEYMAFHGLQHSLSVFSSETNSNKSKKVDIHNELGYQKDDGNKSPLIYDIVQTKP